MNKLPSGNKMNDSRIEIIGWIFIKLSTIKKTLNCLTTRYDRDHRKIEVMQDDRRVN